MAYYMTKIVITTLLIVLISEISKHSTFIGAILASIPLVSVLAMIWLYVDTKDVMQVSELATNIFWLVIPSLALFITFPLLIKSGVEFYTSLSISIGITAACYWIMTTIIRHFNINL